MRKLKISIMVCMFFFIIFGGKIYATGDGTIASPFTALSDAHGQTPGVYNFSIGGQSFSTYIDTGGWIQVAIDFGNGTGDLPQSTSLNNSSRGILTPAALIELTDTTHVRFSHSAGGVDGVTSNSSIISRVLNNQVIHGGTADNTINNDWIGTNPARLTDNGSCTSGNGSFLHENIFHVCGNGSTTAWIPSDDKQRSIWSSGEIPAAESLHLWIRSIAFTQSATTLTVGENGGTGTYTIVLESEPTSDVVIDLASDDTNEGTVAPASLTFTSANWDTAQTVTVTGVDDAAVGNNTATITASINDAASADEFDVLADQTVGITFTDDDAASIVIDPVGITTTGLTLLENGGTGTFNVQLGSEPTSDVVIDLTSNDTGEATVSPATLTFTNTNWNVNQLITLTAVNDDIDRDDSTTLTIAVNDASSDDTYDTVADETAPITITDDDTAAFTQSATTLTVGENGGTGTYTIVLESEPTSDVVIDLASDDTNEGTVAPASLTFTSANWDTAQTVTVTGVDDAAVGNNTATITASINDAASADEFDVLADQTVGITFTDDDAGNTNTGGTTGLKVATSSGATQVQIVSMCDPEAETSNDNITIFPTAEYGGSAAYGDYNTCKSEGNGYEHCAELWVLAIGGTLYEGNNSCSIQRVETEETVKEEVKENSCELKTLQRHRAKRGNSYDDDYYEDEEVNKRNKYYEYLVDLTEQGIINGREDKSEIDDLLGTEGERYAELDEYISRSEAVKLYSIAREDEIQYGSCLGNYFPDVKTGGWYQEYVENLRKKGIVHGYKDGEFKPGQSITFAEVYKVAAISFGYITKEDAEREVEMSKELNIETGEYEATISWYTPYKISLERKNILLPEIEARNNHDYITRGEIMSIMSRGLMEVDEVFN